MRASKPKYRIELEELLKLINERKGADLRKYNMERIENAVKSGGSLKAARTRLGIAENRMYTLIDKEGNITRSIDIIFI